MWQFSWTSLEYVIFDEINFAVLLLVFGYPSGLSSNVFFAYFLLAWGRRLDFGVWSSF
jgi:hypothetical protein